MGRGVEAECDRPGVSGQVRSHQCMELLQLCPNLVPVQSGERDARSLQPCGAVGEDQRRRPQLPHLHHEQLCVRSTITAVSEGIHIFVPAPHTSVAEYEHQCRQLQSDKETKRTLMFGINSIHVWRNINGSCFGCFKDGQM